jgi:hypothetical protein
LKPSELFYPIQVKSDKNGSWEMVMEVFQLIFNAYRSNFVMFLWHFNGKTQRYRRMFGFRKYGFLSFFNGVFERFFWSPCSELLRAFYRGRNIPLEVNGIGIWLHVNDGLSFQVTKVVMVPRWDGVNKGEIAKLFLSLGGCF